MTATTMNAKELNANPYVGRTATTPRPDPATYRGTEASFRRECEQWDAAAAWDADNRRMRAERIASVEAARQGRREAFAAEQRAKAIAAIRARYLAVPGVTEADWEREDHDALLRQQAREQAVVAPAMGHRNVAYQEF